MPPKAGKKKAAATPASASKRAASNAPKKKTAGSVKKKATSTKKKTVAADSKNKKTTKTSATTKKRKASSTTTKKKTVAVAAGGKKQSKASTNKKGSSSAKASAKKTTAKQKASQVAKTQKKPKTATKKPATKKTKTNKVTTSTKVAEDGSVTHSVAMTIDGNSSSAKLPLIHEVCQKAVEELDPMQKDLMENYGLGNEKKCASWNYDSISGELTWSDAKGRVTVQANDPPIIGSYACTIPGSDNGTWMWCFHHPQLKDKPFSLKVKKWLEKNVNPISNMSHLYLPTTISTGGGCWGYAAIGNKALGGRGVYRGPRPDGLGAVFFSLPKKLIMKK